MALPAMISDYSKQQSERFSNLGQSLAQLGQQVGQQLAMREYQRQATAVLPAMQANYRQAFESINRGDYADGYMKMMETNLQFGADQNPFLANAAKQATEMLALAGKQQQSEAWRRLQAGGGGGSGGGISGAEEAKIMTTGGIPAMPMVEEQLPEPDINQPVPEAAPLGAGPDPKAQEEFDKLPVYKQASLENTGKFDMMTPEQRQADLNESLEEDTGAKDYETTNIDLGDFGINVKRIGVPKVKEQVRIKRSVSGATDKPGARVSYSEDIIEVGKDQYKDNKEYVKKIKDAKQLLSSQRPTKDSGTFKKIIQDNGGIFNTSFIPTEDEDEAQRYPYSMIARQGASPIPIMEDVYNAFNVLQKIASLSKASGMKLEPEKEYRGRVSVEPEEEPPANRPPIGSFFGVK